jgi:hypothetical protein
MALLIGYFDHSTLEVRRYPIPVVEIVLATKAEDRHLQVTPGTEERLDCALRIYGTSTSVYIRPMCGRSTFKLTWERIVRFYWLTLALQPVLQMERVICLPQ